MELVTLVGSNPLSSFASLATLRPNRAVLVHTAQTHQAARSLAAVVDQLSGSAWPSGCETSTLEVPPDLAGEVREVLEDLSGDWLLDYTGGTKAMSCGARLAYEAHRPTRDLPADPAGAFYVDDASGALVADDGTRTPIDETAYSIANIAALHGAEFREPLRRGRVAGTDWEEYVGGRVRDWGEGRGPGNAEVVLNQRVAVGEDRDFEIDVLVRVGRRVGLVSCYAGNDYTTAKHKLFEAVERARQLGGDLARVAVAAPLNSRQRRHFRNDLGRRWVPNRPRLITRDDLSAADGARALLDDWWDSGGR